MAKFSLTKNPFNVGFNYPIISEWYTMPGAMKAAEIAIGEMKSHRVPGALPDPKDSEAAKLILAERKKTQSQPWTESQAQKKEPHFIWIVDTDMGDTSFRGQGKSFRMIQLPTVPLELEFDPKPNWAIIASIGRNNPFYHYTGSEDTLSFKIDWYSKMENRQDVIFNCRWLAARSKANGYFEDPHRIMIIWGKESVLFQNSFWIVTKASYKLSQFQKQASMLPNQAYQEVELKRVTETNTDYDELLGNLFPFERADKPEVRYKID